MSEHDARPGRAGRPEVVRALTTLSPVIDDARRRMKLRFRLGFVRRFPGLSRPVSLLRFIHYGRWLVLSDLPAADGSGVPVPLNTSYLLFDVAYDATTAPELQAEAEADDYLDAFADTLPARLIALWGNCEQFGWRVERASGARERVAPWAFREYVHDNSLEELFFHRGYDASVPDVRQAMALAEERSGEEDPPALADLALGPVPRPRSFLRRTYLLIGAWLQANAGHYGVNPLNLVAPLEIDEQAARAAFAGLDAAVPLDHEQLTHFAACHLIPRTLTDLGQRRPDVVQVPYLLFTATHFGSAPEYVESLRTSKCDRVDELFGHCAGYPADRERTAFHAWFDRHLRPTSYFVPGYPPQPPTAIRNALEERDRLAAGLRRELMGRP
jgi:hypothetical protein